jgi:hypothetical protein
VAVTVDPPALGRSDDAVALTVPARGASTTEVELQYRYRGAPQEIVPIELAGLPLNRSKRVDLIDTYFDTEQLALRDAHCSLRIRREHGRQPRLVWKGPPRHRPDGAKAREERQVVFSGHLDPSEFGALLASTGLADIVVGLIGPEACAQIRSIGELHNERSVHVYGSDECGLELVWDRLQYPTGPAETRLEVEATDANALDLLAVADEELRAVLGPELEASRRGKARELFARLQVSS